MERLLEPPQRLRMNFAYLKPENEDSEKMAAMLLEQGSLLRSDGLRRMLANAKQLRVLDLSSLQGIPAPGGVSFHDLKLKCVLDGLTFLQLGELHLGNYLTPER